MTVKTQWLAKWLAKHGPFRTEAVQETMLLYKEAVQRRRVKAYLMIDSQFRVQKNRREM